MSNKEILKWKKELQTAAQYVQFLDNLEESLAGGDDAAFLYLDDDGDDQEVPAREVPDQDGRVSLRLMVLQWLWDRLQRDVRRGPVHTALLKQRGRPVHVRADHLTRDLWWVEINPPASPDTKEVEAATRGGGILSIAYIRNSRYRLLQ